MEDKEMLVEQLENAEYEPDADEAEATPLADIPEDANLETVTKTVKTVINPETGETVVVGEADDFDASFEDMVKKINESNDDGLFDKKPISEKDVVEYLSENKNDSILSQIAPDTGLTPDDIQGVLQVANRVINKEQFNIYRALPEAVRGMIDSYIGAGDMMGANTAQLNQIKKAIAESLLEQFISDIQINRAKNDFATELQQIYETSGKELADANLEYIEDRNKAYREAADQIEDEAKREKLKAILDRIDEARALTELKEFAKTCKIKPIEMEKPDQRCFAGFLNKYKNSSNNIYDINLAGKALYRNMSAYGCTERDIVAFLIAFTKQVMRYSVDNPLDHAYMYYVLYYCAMIDSDKAETFKLNVKEVIDNLHSRNPAL